MGTLSHDEARRTYDRIGAVQDSQHFYEDPATDRLRSHGRFETAERVFEFGCGTGRFACRLIEEHLPENAHYRGVDVSPEMVRLARERLAGHAGRAEVIEVDGKPRLDEPDESHDRFVSNYVLDLLSEADIRALVAEARRILRPGGLLCLTGLSGGVGNVSRIVAGAVRGIHAIWPALLGGCRPIELREFVSEPDWRIQHHSKVVAFGIASEILIAARPDEGPAPIDSGEGARRDRR